MKRLLIDLDACSDCDECSALCTYIQHPGNNGMTSLREFAHFAILCRRCDDAPCVASCPWEALEMQASPARKDAPAGGPARLQGMPQQAGGQDYNMLKRYMMRCTSCKSCSRACPFGVIYPETIPFITSRCDFCIGRMGGENVPICLQSCTDKPKGNGLASYKPEGDGAASNSRSHSQSHDGVKYGEYEENKEEHIYKVSEYVLVKTNYKWERVPEPPIRKR